MSIRDAEPASVLTSLRSRSGSATMEYNYIAHAEECPSLSG
jgi:hypothetical protein